MKMVRMEILQNARQMFIFIMAEKILLEMKEYNGILYFPILLMLLGTLIYIK